MGFEGDCVLIFQVRFRRRFDVDKNRYTSILEVIIVLSSFILGLRAGGLEWQRDIFVPSCLGSLWCFGDCGLSLYSVWTAHPPEV
ncbi:hypothetical protein BJX68DRAFT_226060 [Aspergillus pseudodeflectus]|uniref:Uncharacterized protein n=1 Tax=Aspergillus pseudodeflectus TaxID=176178 RepID=A0ABR4L3Z4_9EURO